MNVIGYLRVSGQSQVAGDGFPRQEAAITEFCKKNDLNLLSFVREEGVSGTTMDRPAFTRMVADFEDLKPDAVVIERLDRLARDLMVQELHLQELRELGVALFSADQGVLNIADNGADPSRILIRQVLGAVAQYEKSALVSKLRAARERTGRFGGRSPFGTKYLHEKRVLLRILALYDAGIQQRMICRALTAEDLRTSKGTVYRVSFINRIIQRFRTK